MTEFLRQYIHSTYWYLPWTYIFSHGVMIEINKDTKKIIRIAPTIVIFRKHYTLWRQATINCNQW